ncbi:MAG: iron-containing alcohol dehydrogenase [Synergistaceae bacterium]|nr:iron-containing alcohol dehydrogenase [Synergistaceae bacterium]MBQ3627078.1 iron-containing alcohol dehydrogenase [Synergistaceae bacterium]MBQ7569439.1 iron-containing alcohol dehydrogenase [Synergistaceae bacterium]MBQ9581807.1 iron-containing alcohol dehydrogenase [Synergistaceae bacterium]MBQ9896183.1 iron-containing alcohol dehydrogenase [Synergistaceae bacterium]
MSENKINFTEIGGVKPNPRIDKVREAVSNIKMQAESSPNEKFDAIIPIGGGSVFDSSKVIAVGAFGKLSKLEPEDVLEIYRLAY